MGQRRLPILEAGREEVRVVVGETAEFGGRRDQKGIGLIEFVFGMRAEVDLSGHST